MVKKLVDLEEFCEMTSLGMNTARKIIKYQDFPKIYVGNRVKIIVSEIDNFFLNHQNERL